jgi:hypothetical protein
LDARPVSAYATEENIALMAGAAGSGRGSPTTDVLLERDVERGLLADLVRDVGAGRGQVLLLESAAGLGKSAGGPMA